MDKFAKMLLEEIKIFWEELKDGCKRKSKKLSVSAKEIKEYAEKITT